MVNLTVTPDRTQFIEQFLERHEIEYRVDQYRPTGRNIYAVLPGRSPRVVGLMAHHDVKNPELENAQDNSASVANLLRLSLSLKQTPPDVTVVLIFTDEEEIVSLTVSGAARVARLIKAQQYPFIGFSHAINLELTGAGPWVWADLDSFENCQNLVSPDKITKLFPNITKVKTPFNDATILRYHGIDCVCVGLFPDESLEDYRAERYPEVWGLCHRSDDTVDKCSEYDMERFVFDVLLPLTRS